MEFYKLKDIAKERYQVIEKKLTDDTAINSTTSNNTMQCFRFAIAAFIWAEKCNFLWKGGESTMRPLVANVHSLL